VNRLPPAAAGKAERPLRFYCAALLASAALHAALAVGLGELLPGGRSAPERTAPAAQPSAPLMLTFRPPAAASRTEEVPSAEGLARKERPPSLKPEAAPQPVPAPEPDPAVALHSQPQAPPSAASRPDGSEAAVRPSGAALQSAAPLTAGRSAGRVNAAEMKPRPLKPIDPPYPLGSRLRGEQGVVRLRVRVAADGRVEGLEVERSSGFPALDRSAARAVRKVRFSPAVRGRQPVAEWLTISVRFVLDS
jgi:protein TonB